MKAFLMVKRTNIEKIRLPNGGGGQQNELFLSNIPTRFLRIPIVKLNLIED